MDKYCKRLIEVDLPIKRISAHASREKNIRRGHISSLHIWWARRPLAACRATICASLWPDPADDLCPEIFRKAAREQMTKWAKNHLRLVSKDSYLGFVAISKDESILEDMVNLRTALLDFIADFANWNNSTVFEYLEASRLITKYAHQALRCTGGSHPVVYDPFAGGGAIPFEAARISAQSIAGDLNPIATLLNKIILEFVPKYKKLLVKEVEHWAKRYLNKIQESLKEYYPSDKDSNEPIAYFWARTIKCEGPHCGVNVPIIKNFQFATRTGSEAAVKIEYKTNQLVTTLILGSNARGIHGGTSRRGSVTCPKCGYTTKRVHVEKQANESGFGYHLFAVCVRFPGDKKRTYRSPTKEDFLAIDRAENDVQNWDNTQFDGVSAIPHEELPYLRSIFNVRIYGIDEWAKLFTPRQLHSNLTQVNAFREICHEIKTALNDEGLFNAVSSCIALIISNGFQYQCNIATYLSDGIVSAFIQGQSLGMKMDFVEANPLMFDLVGGIDYSIKKQITGLEHLAKIDYKEGSATQISALDSFLPDDSCDLLFTDPPYYDVIPYSDCSDFFYVWVRRMLINNSTFKLELPLTPKDDEIVQLAERNQKYKERTKSWYEDRMRIALEKARIAVPPNGCGVIVFAHKDTNAWEALLQATLDAGWIITASWPIDTENAGRLRAKSSAVLSSSIHLVCRPRENADGSLSIDDIGDWRDVLSELPKRIHKWMPRLAEEGVVGADAIFACLGPALEIYSRYSSVEKSSGEKVELTEYLEEIWVAVAHEALNMIFKGADASGFEEDARLTAMWLWTLRTTTNVDKEDVDEGGLRKSLSGYNLEYDAARKIAQGLGANLDNLSHMVEIKGGIATLLSAAARTRYLFGKDAAEVPKGKRKKKDQQMHLNFTGELNRIEEESRNIIGELTGKPGSTVLDQLHQSMILFAAGRGEAVKRFIVEEGVGLNPHFWRLANALSALYPIGTDEKRWVDGVLARKKGLGF